MEVLWKWLELESRCAWAKFKELSPILTVRGASYRIKGSAIVLVSRVF